MYHTDTRREYDSDDEDGLDSTCGMCLASHMCVRKCLAVLWVVTLPFKCAEQVMFLVPLNYLKRVGLRGTATLVAGMVVGAVLSWALFQPLATNTHHGTVCTTYLSLMAWCVGHLAVYAAVAYKAMVLIKLTHMCGLQTNSPQCVLPISLSEPAYLGLLMGLLIQFGEIAFVSRTSWQWCRASPHTPAEAFYIPVAVMACISAMVFVPHGRYDLGYARDLSTHGVEHSTPVTRSYKPEPDSDVIDHGSAVPNTVSSRSRSVRFHPYGADTRTRTRTRTHTTPVTGGRDEVMEMGALADVELTPPVVIRRDVSRIHAGPHSVVHIQPYSEAQPQYNEVRHTLVKEPDELHKHHGTPPLSAPVQRESMQPQPFSARSTP